MTLLCSGTSFFLECFNDVNRAVSIEMDNEQLATGVFARFIASSVNQS